MHDRLNTSKQFSSTSDNMIYYTILDRLLVFFNLISTINGRLSEVRSEGDF